MTTPVFVALGVVVALLAGVGGTLLFLGPSAPAPSPVPAAVAPAAVPQPFTAAPVADPLSELGNQRTADLPEVESLVGSWVPQLSSKRVGGEAEGRTWDPEAVLDEHRALRAAHPQARLVWSGDFASFAAGDFWITLLANPSSTAEGANAWCDSAGFDADHCYAKRLMTTGGPDGNSLLRDGRGVSTPGAGSPDVGPN